MIMGESVNSEQVLEAIQCKKDLKKGLKNVAGFVVVVFILCVYMFVIF